MLVQYEEDRPLPPPAAWSQQDTEGSWLLISLAWIGVLIGVGGALYWARLSILGAVYGSSSDTVGFVWLAITAAGAAIIAPVLWPFLKERRPEIATFVLVVGVISWLLTSAMGTLFLIEKSERPTPVNELPVISANQFEKDRHSISDAERDCFYGVIRGCDWLNSQNGANAQARRHQYGVELGHRPPRPAAQARSFSLADMAMRLGSRFPLLLMVAFGGSIALALIWGPAEALKAMWSEPGAFMPRPGTPAVGLPDAPGMPLLGNPIDAAFESWAAQCLERARGDRVPLATLHSHYVAYCMRRGLAAFASDAAFGRALNQPRDPLDPTDLGGPMVRLQGWPHKTGGKMEYVDVRIRPDDILDEIEAASEA